MHGCPLCAEYLEPGRLGSKMDDYMFRSHVKHCSNVVEKTSYLEIFNYSVSLLRSEGSPAAALYTTALLTEALDAGPV